MIDFADIEFNKKWNDFLNKFSMKFDKKPDLNALLYLIGVQELGKGPQDFTKEQKQDLMHIATCKLFSALDYFELEGLDSEGWPHWKQTKPMPTLTLLEQEKLLKIQILDYFEDII